MKQILLIISCLFFLLHAQAKSINDSLLLYMPFNGNTNDESGNNNHGTVHNNATLTVDKNGNLNSAYNFDGINSYIEIPASPSLEKINSSNEITISAWIKIRNWYQGWNVFAIFEQDNPTTDLGATLFEANWAAGGILFVSGDNTNGIGCNYTWNFNVWHNVAVTYSVSLGTAKFYVDGVLTCTQPYTTQFTHYTTHLFSIGRSLSGPDEYSDGVIDELRIYNRVLTDIEIVTLQNENTPPIVSITTPTNNATFGVGAYIKINAAASDADDTITKVEFYNGNTLLHTETVVPYGYQWKHVPVGSYTLTVKATDNSGNVTTSAPVHITVIPNKAPTVNITNPPNNQTIAGPATICLSAEAKDPDGKITSVEFYNGATLLRIEYYFPYTFAWKDVPVGSYSITAKAFDNLGAVTTSPPVNISVVPNKAPTVSITNPADNESFATPATIPLIASANDPDGTISKVEFYSGDTWLNTQYIKPYTHTMREVPAGTYTITAKAIDNLGLSTISAPVTITVTGTNTSIVSSKPSSSNNISGLKEAISLKVSPNPARNVVNIYTKGLQQNKPTTLSVISASGAVMKTMPSNSSTQTIQIDVSSLVKGVYTIKFMSANRALYKQFVKL